MNAACSIGRQMRHPAVGDQLVDDELRAILYQMGAVQQHDARTILPGGGYVCGALLDGVQFGGMTRNSRLTRINQEPIDRAQALALSQRIDSHACKIDPRRKLFHVLNEARKNIRS